MSRLSSAIGDLRSKLETIAWFAARPAMYRELGRRVVHARLRTARSLEQDQSAKRAGTEWCGRVAIPVPELLARLGAPGDIAVLANEKPEEWRLATRAFEACGGSMGGPAHVDLLHHLVKWKRPERVVETGVAAGWSSLAMLLAMEDVGHGHLTSVDMPYPKRKNEDLVGCVVPGHLRHRWTLVREPDRDALPRILSRGKIGMAHYDSDKSCEGRDFAYPRLWDALEPGGILVSDDVEDNLAFRDFAARVGREPWVVDKGRGNFAGILVR